MLLTLLLVGAGAAFARIQYLPLAMDGDYGTYRDAAAHIAEGAPVTHDVALRMLKPLPLLVIAALAPAIGYESATLVQAVLFYFALIVAMFLLAHEFLKNRELAAYATLLVMLSYPVLKYGLELLTETGGLFFYIISLWLALCFVATPTWKLLLWNAVVVTVGFFWKEYAIVSAVIFGLAILFHAALSWRAKAYFVAAYGAIFLGAHVPWQMYVDAVYQYSYQSWFSEGGAVGYASEYTLKNIVKSTAALLGIAWLLVPLGARSFGRLHAVQRRFLALAMLPPLVSFAWGYITSRLLYVLAPQFVLLAVEGMRPWRREAQIAAVGVTILGNVLWLFMSYSITL